MIILILLRIFIVLYFVLLSKLIISFRELKTAIMTVNGDLQQVNDRFENLLQTENLKPENVINFLAQVGSYNKELEPLNDRLSNLNIMINNNVSELLLLISLLFFFLSVLYALAISSED